MIKKLLMAILILAFFVGGCTNEYDSFKKDYVRNRVHEDCINSHEPFCSITTDTSPYEKEAMNRYQGIQPINIKIYRDIINISYEFECYNHSGGKINLFEYDYGIRLYESHGNNGLSINKYNKEPYYYETIHPNYETNVFLPLEFDKCMFGFELLINNTESRDNIDKTYTTKCSFGYVLTENTLTEYHNIKNFNDFYAIVSDNYGYDFKQSSENGIPIGLVRETMDADINYCLSKLDD